MSLRRLAGRLVGAALLAFVPLAFAGQAAAQELRIGLRNEPTALDPQYQNSQANNQIALHIFEPLVARDAPRLKALLAGLLCNKMLSVIASLDDAASAEHPNRATVKESA